MGNSVAIQIWLTFFLSIVKDLIFQFVINNEKFRRGFLRIKRVYLLIRLPYFTFLKHYKNFIREKNEIFALMMSDYQDSAGDTKKDPVFFFSALTQYWLLKKTLIKQYEKILNIHLIDDHYDIFEDEIKQAKAMKTSNSLKRLIWKIKMVDEDFKEMMNTSVKNLQFLKEMINKSSEENTLNDCAKMDSLEDKKLDILRSYIQDLLKLIKSWKSGNNKIKNIEKFELYTETKLIQKYVKQLGVKIRHEDSVNILRITNILNNSLTNIVQSVQDSKDKKYGKKLIKAERVYLKIYYRLLIKKYLLLEYSKKPIHSLSSSDASLIIQKSGNYLKEKEDLLKKSEKEISEKERWSIAYRLWELNEIRKNICLTYLDIDNDFSKWVVSYEKLTSLASKSQTQIKKEDFDIAEKFLKNNINPTKIFKI